MTGNRVVAYLRPHETLSTFEMGYVSLLRSKFDLRIITTGNRNIGGEPEGVIRMRWPDEFEWKGRSKSPLNAVYARLMKRRYHIPGLSCVLEGVSIVQGLEAASEVSYQAARLKERFGYRLLLSASENTPISANQSATVRERIAFTLRNVDHAFAITRAARDRLVEEGYDPARITVIGHGTDCERFSPPRETRREGGFRVGYCGRFRREKGLEHLVEAMRGIDGELLLLGDGPQRGRLAGSGPRVRVMDPVPHAEIHEFYRTIDVFVLPSVPMEGMAEQFGFVLIEAMASGVPVVASAAGSIPEVVGDDAILVPPGDPDALRSAIEIFRRRPELRLEYSRRGRARAVERFRREDVAARMESVYGSLLAR